MNEEKVKPAGAKPCPLCKGQLVVDVVPVEGAPEYFGNCEDIQCPLHTADIVGGSVEGVTKLWNTRPAEQELVEALRHALERGDLPSAVESRFSALISKHGGGA